MKQIRLLIVAILSLALATAADAQNADEKAALMERVAGFQEAMRTGDHATVFDTTPPRIHAYIAESSGMTTAELRTATIPQMAELMADATIEVMEMDVAETRYESAPDGTPYALIPSRLVMQMPKVGKISSSGHTLGVMDEGQWYLLNISNDQELQIFRQLYPSFEDVEFPAGTLTVEE